MCTGIETIQRALGMELANLPWNGTSQCALGMGLVNVSREWG